MFCSKCGKEVLNGARFCPGCGAEVSVNINEPVQGQQNQELPKMEIPKVEAKKNQTEYPSHPGDIKTFNVLSYIGLMWIIGMVCGSRKNPRVRFHVGQGILVSILGVALSIVSVILTMIIGAAFAPKTIFGLGQVNVISLGLIGLINLACAGIMIFYVVIGIIHAAKGEDKPLPIIGNLAFYK